MLSPTANRSPQQSLYKAPTVLTQKCWLVRLQLKRCVSPKFHVRVINISGFKDFVYFDVQHLLTSFLLTTLFPCQFLLMFICMYEYEYQIQNVPP